jgi:hypothetical protein
MFSILFVGGFLPSPVYGSNNTSCLVRNNRGSSNPAENYDYNVKSGKHCQVLRSLELRPNRYQGVADVPEGSCSFNSDSDIVVEEREGLNPVSTTTISNGGELVLSCAGEYEMFRKDRNKVGCVDGSLNIEFDGCRIPAVFVFRDSEDGNGFRIKNGSNDCIVDWGDGSEPSDCLSPDNSLHYYTSAGDHTAKIIGNTFLGFDGCYDSRIKKIYSMGKWKNNITDMTGTFVGCDFLDYVHPDAFKYLTEVTSFQGIFDGCYSLTSVPSGLFANNKKVESFSYAFSFSGLTSVPSDLFEVDFESRPSFGSMFESTLVPCSVLATQRWWSGKTLNEIATETRCMDDSAA